MERHKHLLWIALSLVPALAGCRVNASTVEAKAPPPQSSHRHGVASQVMQASNDQCQGETPTGQPQTPAE
ncbi:hypothetical protein LZC95_43525 [Pendulispora brunnea]|uniref:Secreted protein n=1 Tax=Pendulispora brunnea TaxID=2905690 RepID=A0ABZ2K3U8_9BACT